MAFDELGPSIRILVEGQDVSADLTDYIVSCKVEQSQEMAWKTELDVLNVPNDSVGVGWDGTYLFTDSKLFSPGNRIVVSMGYGGKNRVVGAGLIQKFLPRFAQTGAPKLKVVAYDGRVLMMEGPTAQDAASWEETAHSTVVRDIADKYGFIAEITETTSEKSTLKKQGMSDWELVQGLARLHGYYAVVVWDDDRLNWVLRWGPADTIWPQEKQYTMVYATSGNDNTLLDFSASLVIKGLPTAVKLHYFDKDTGTWEEVLFEETEDGESLKYTGTTSGSPQSEVLKSSSYRISTGGVSVEVVPRSQFESAEDAIRFAQRWFQERKDQFITSEGKLVGLEVLDVGQIHRLEGVGKQLSGEYQFTTVRHEWTQRGFWTKFFAHKVVS